MERANSNHSDAPALLATVAPIGYGSVNSKLLYCSLHRAPLERRQRQHLHHVKKSPKALLDTHSFRVTVLIGARCARVLRAAVQPTQTAPFAQRSTCCCARAGGLIVCHPNALATNDHDRGTLLGTWLWCVRRGRVQSSRSAAAQRPIIPTQCMPAVTGGSSVRQGNGGSRRSRLRCAVQTSTS